MARYIGPKFKIDRRLGSNLMLKGERSRSPKHPLEKKGAVPPGQHGIRSLKRKPSDYSIQLKEKQKVKYMYGLLERQFKRFFQLASKSKGKTGEKLLELLERRLDNVIYRLSFASSRAQARQMVSHGHIIVNDKKVNIPSYITAVNDIISVKPTSSGLELIKKSLKESSDLPPWLDRKGTVGKVKSLPGRDVAPAEINEQLIVEYYSR
ncbi:MAG: 30S ribosomal protein S4 [Candidatus Woykebacteria bacterium RBG_13_40_7b]|uniref:Small ribosomal subunit protein uS4 n=1 Tax=Candidatus Woykebacteria bacterium RBG_13_40_7b TaxID=1802594 RepID=A0A1G1W7W5_9BACT|nr:MAG: 30S ribosomal protein S4 [Candidatus Woykebacteria bacterium RBG_13_40_7b]